MHKDNSLRQLKYKLFLKLNKICNKKIVIDNYKNEKSKKNLGIRYYFFHLTVV